MRVLTLLAMLLAVASGVRAQGQTGAAAEPPGLPVSAERVSEGLHAEPLVIPPLPQSDTIFHVDVQAGWPRETALDAVRKELAGGARGSTPSLPSVPGVTPAPAVASVDVLPMIGAAIQKIKDVRRAHAEEKARQTVAEDLAAFCAVHDCSQTEQAAVEVVIVR